jgi:hypothetical protein
LIILAVYALVIWALALVWRRRLLGFVFVVAGAGGALLVSAALASLTRSTTDTGYPMILLLRAEAGIILLVGVFIASLPRRDPVVACATCGTDLSAQRSTHPVCTACGSVSGRCEYCGHSLNGLPARITTCPECGVSRDGSTWTERPVPAARAAAPASADLQRTASAARAAKALGLPLGDAPAGPTTP